jgi:L-histidine Nalpha-methyltransferase
MEVMDKKLIVLAEAAKDKDFARDVAEGLSNYPKRIPSKYFYDEAGSRLFEEIMELEEYYPTQCERDIFNNYKEEILQAIDSSFLLVDIGAGDADKTKILLKHFLKKAAKFSYVPIDISREILEQLAGSLEDEFPTLKTQAVIAEYFDALEWLKRNESSRKLVLFMGGNIGNFRKDAAVGFLSKMKAVLHPGDLLLIGIDLRKDPRLILRAYDDTKGVTARFNFNLLERINTELGGDFDLAKWSHYPTYDPQSGEVQSFLISTEKQEVFISELNKSFAFNAFEAIHTEYSCKYTPAEIEKLSRDTGFEVVRHFFDSRHYFTDSLWRVG